MSYSPEDLQSGIVEFFDDAASLSLRPWDFGTLPLSVGLRSLRSLDTTRLRMKVTRVARVMFAPQRQAGPHSKLVCNFCGARSSQHRCPVTGAVVS
jgi:hypothetical protein